MHLHFSIQPSPGPHSSGFPLPICKETSSLPQLIDPFQAFGSAPTICREEPHSRNLWEVTSNSLLFNSLQKFRWRIAWRCFLFLYRIKHWQNASNEGRWIKQSYIIQWQSLWGIWGNSSSELRIASLWVPSRILNSVPRARDKGALPKKLHGFF